MNKDDDGKTDIASLSVDGNVRIGRKTLYDTAKGYLLEFRKITFGVFYLTLNSTKFGGYSCFLLILLEFFQLSSFIVNPVRFNWEGGVAKGLFEFLGAFSGVSWINKLTDDQFVLLMRIIYSLTLCLLILLVYTCWGIEKDKLFFTFQIRVFKLFCRLSPILLTPTLMLIFYPFFHHSDRKNYNNISLADTILFTICGFFVVWLCFICAHIYFPIKPFLNIRVRRSKIYDSMPNNNLLVLNFFAKLFLSFLECFVNVSTSKSTSTHILLLLLLCLVLFASKIFTLPYYCRFTNCLSISLSGLMLFGGLFSCVSQLQGLSKEESIILIVLYIPIFVFFLYFSSSITRFFYHRHKKNPKNLKDFLNAMFSPLFLSCLSEKNLSAQANVSASVPVADPQSSHNVEMATLKSSESPPMNNRGGSLQLKPKALQGIIVSGGLDSPVNYGRNSGSPIMLDVDGYNNNQEIEMGRMSVDSHFDEVKDDGTDTNKKKKTKKKNKWDYDSSDDEADNKNSDLYFPSETHVELYTRFLMRHRTEEDLDKAENIFQEGFRAYPLSDHIRLQYCIFLETNLDDTNLIHQRFNELAKSDDLSLFSKFMIYREIQDYKKKSFAGDLDAGGIEETNRAETFRKNIERIDKVFDMAVHHLANFWRSLLDEEIELQVLGETVNSIIYRGQYISLLLSDLMKQYPEEPATLRRYGKNLELLQCDEEGAMQYYQQADILEEAKLRKTREKLFNKEDGSCKISIDSDGNVVKMDEKAEVMFQCPGSMAISMHMNISLLFPFSEDAFILESESTDQRILGVRSDGAIVPCEFRGEVKGKRKIIHILSCEAQKRNLLFLDPVEKVVEGVSNEMVVNFEVLAEDFVDVKLEEVFGEETANILSERIEKGEPILDFPTVLSPTFDPRVNESVIISSFDFHLNIVSLEIMKDNSFIKNENKDTHSDEKNNDPQEDNPETKTMATSKQGRFISTKRQSRRRSSGETKLVDLFGSWRTKRSSAEMKLKQNQGAEEEKYFNNENYAGTYDHDKNRNSESFDKKIMSNKEQNFRSSVDIELAALDVSSAGGGDQSELEDSISVSNVSESINPNKKNEDVFNEEIRGRQQHSGIEPTETSDSASRDDSSHASSNASNKIIQKYREELKKIESGKVQSNALREFNSVIYIFLVIALVSIICTALSLSLYGSMKENGQIIKSVSDLVTIGQKLSMNVRELDLILRNSNTSTSQSPTAVQMFALSRWKNVTSEILKRGIEFSGLHLSLMKLLEKDTRVWDKTTSSLILNLTSIMGINAPDTLRFMNLHEAGTEVDRLSRYLGSLNESTNQSDLNGHLEFAFFVKEVHEELREVINRLMEEVRQFAESEAEEIIVISACAFFGLVLVLLALGNFTFKPVVEQVAKEEEMILRSFLFIPRDTVVDIMFDYDSKVEKNMEDDVLNNDVQNNDMDKQALEMKGDVVGLMDLGRSDEMRKEEEIEKQKNRIKRKISKRHINAHTASMRRTHFKYMLALLSFGLMNFVSFLLNFNASKNLVELQKEIHFSSLRHQEVGTSMFFSNEYISNSTDFFDGSLSKSKIDNATKWLSNFEDWLVYGNSSKDLKGYKQSHSDQYKFLFEDVCVKIDCTDLADTYKLSASSGFHSLVQEYETLLFSVRDLLPVAGYDDVTYKKLTAFYEHLIDVGCEYSSNLYLNSYIVLADDGLSVQILILILSILLTILLYLGIFIPTLSTLTEKTRKSKLMFHLIPPQALKEVRFIGKLLRLDDNSSADRANESINNSKKAGNSEEPSKSVSLQKIVVEAVDSIFDTIFFFTAKFYGLLENHPKLAVIVIATPVWILFFIYVFAFKGFKQTAEVFHDEYAFGLLMGVGAISSGSSPLDERIASMTYFAGKDEITAEISNNFGVIVQTILKCSAALYIVFTGVKVDWWLFRKTFLSGVIGLLLGFATLDGAIDMDTISSVYSSIGFSSALSSVVFHFVDKSEKVDQINVLKSDTSVQYEIFLIGFLGGLFSSIAETGLDLFIFTVTTTFFQLKESVAIPTSICILAANSFVGLIFKYLLNGSLNSTSVDYALVSIPLIVLVAPMTVYVISKNGEQVWHWMFAIFSVSQFIVLIYVVIPKRDDLVMVVIIMVIMFAFIFFQISKGGKIRQAILEMESNIEEQAAESEKKEKNRIDEIKKLLKKRKRKLKNTARAIAAMKKKI